ncbi:tyrosine phosphatase-like protein [Chlamydoabsidia padenii]|nr:tyrosine phosphatase-like protein [Chlamydoabsidia padenii]
MSTSDRATEPKTKKGFLRTYLLAYNILSWSGWFHILVLVTIELAISGGDWEDVFEMTWPALQIVQTAALFEVFHSMVGWVRAPFFTTLIQVLSRLLLVWGVNAVFPEIRTHGSYTTMIIAWCIAELVRYSFYAFNLKNGSVPSIISWARYNFFLVLYPLGVSSELMMIYQALPYAKEIHSAYYYALIAAALSYAPGFPILFSHMLSQRKKYLKSTVKKSD